MVGEKYKGYNVTTINNTICIGLAYSNENPQPGMLQSFYKSDNDRFKAAWHVAHCRDE